MIGRFIALFLLVFGFVSLITGAFVITIVTWFIALVILLLEELADQYDI